MLCEQKILYLVTGPIGSGKSTLIKPFIEIYRLNNIELISTDLYLNALFLRNTASLSESYSNAKDFTWYKLKKKLEKQEPFIWETVLTKRNKIDFLLSCKNSSYKIVTMFIYVNSVELSIERVERRHKEGCYNIPRVKTITRYNEMMDNLRFIYEASDEFMAIDNSNNYPQLAFYAVDGKSKYFNKEITNLGIQ